MDPIRSRLRETDPIYLTIGGVGFVVVVIMILLLF